MPWAVVGGLLVTLGAVAIGLTYTSMFHAKHITVAGEQHLSEARVLQIAGIGPGTDLFHLDVGSVERRLERNPWIADAAVVRHLPSTVTVTVSERHPVGLTRSADGHLLYVANDGRLLGPAPGTPLLPEISTSEPSSMAAAASVAQTLPASLRPVVASIAVDGDGTVTLTTRSGVTATYGDASHAQAKGEALQAVLDYATNEGKSPISVDVAVPGAPTAVFTETAVASPDPRP